MVERLNVPTEFRANLSDECLVLMEEVITSNRKLAEENKKLREEHERKPKHMQRSSNGSSSSRRAEEMLKWEMLLKDVSIVKDRSHKLWYQLHVELSKNFMPEI